MANIIVAFPKPEDAAAIRKLLQRGGFHVSAVCSSGATALQAADQIGSGIIVCGYRLKDMLYSELAELLPGGCEMVLIASENLVSSGVYGNVTHIPMPLKVQTLLQTLEKIAADFERMRKQKRQAPGKRSILQKQTIEKAKEKLMQRQGITEDEAHRYIQKISMDSGTNMAETAAMLLSFMDDDDE